MKAIPLRWAACVAASMMVFTASAQDTPPPSDAPAPPARGEHGNRGHFRGSRGGDGFRMLLGRAADKLGLTDEQKEKIAAIAKEDRDANQTHRRAVMEARRALNDLAQADTVDEAAVRGQATKLADAEAEAALAQAKTAAKVREVLTPEQQKEFKEMKEKFSDRRNNRKPGDRGPRSKRGGAGQEAPASSPAEDNDSE